MEILIGIGARLIDELNRCVDTSNHIPDYWSRSGVGARAREIVACADKGWIKSLFNSFFLFLNGSMIDSMVKCFPSFGGHCQVHQCSLKHKFRKQEISGGKHTKVKSTNNKSMKRSPDLFLLIAIHQIPVTRLRSGYPTLVCGAGA